MILYYIPELAAGPIATAKSKQTSELTIYIKITKGYGNVSASEETSGVNSVFGPSHFLGDLPS